MSHRLILLVVFSAAFLKFILPIWVHSSCASGVLVSLLPFIGLRIGLVKEIARVPNGGGTAKWPGLSSD
jgi:hypothetical protein